MNSDCSYCEAYSLALFGLVLNCKICNDPICTDCAGDANRYDFNKENYTCAKCFNDKFKIITKDQLDDYEYTEIENNKLKAELKSLTETLKWLQEQIDLKPPNGKLYPGS